MGELILIRWERSTIAHITLEIFLGSIMKYKLSLNVDVIPSALSAAVIGSEKKIGSTRSIMSAGL